MMDGLDDGPDLLAEDPSSTPASTSVDNNNKGLRAETVDLSTSDLMVDISDALSERDKVKFTVHTKVWIGSHLKNYFILRKEEDDEVESRRRRWWRR